MTSIYFPNEVDQRYLDGMKALGKEPRMIGDKINPVDALYSDAGMQTTNRTLDDQSILNYANPSTKNMTLSKAPQEMRVMIAEGLRNPAAIATDVQGRLCTNTRCSN